MIFSNISPKFQCLKTVVLLCFLSHYASCQNQNAQQKVSNEIIGSESSLGSNPIKNSVANPSPPSQNHYREYGSAFYYPAQKPVIWNRDTYADAASDFGYNPIAQQSVHHQSSHGGSHQSYAPSTEYGVSDGYEEEGAGGFGGLGGLGGLAGLAGVLGVKGIKGLGILGVMKAVGLPLLLLALPAILLLPLVFLFLPVPVITIPSNPGAGRSNPLNNGFKFGDFSAKVTHLARSVLESEKCVERISCELSRVSKGTFIDKTVKRVIEKFETHLPKSLQRMARAYMDQASYCGKKYACYLVDDNSVKKSL